MTQSLQDSKLPERVIGRDIVFFDGQCVLCNGAMKSVLENDQKKHFLICAQQSEMGQRLLSRHNVDLSSLKTIYVIRNCGTANESILDRGRAVLYLMQNLDKFRPLAAIGRIFPAPFIDFFYKFVANIRYRVFGKTETCMMPTPEEREHFLE
ncbi:MAG: DCC1-like thiol-disulfide oxidoreductase family protein [Candidatus Obscuribacterales bacterium]|jgi:predicted DCC family thiol-disulfide oxidoreductase YuxK|nr:DCC1-like thiol-disulfide oxidoreductase family protein [Candidatus Obscuribacterales bacterium]